MRHMVSNIKVREIEKFFKELLKKKDELREEAIPEEELSERNKKIYEFYKEKGFFAFTDDVRVCMVVLKNLTTVKQALEFFGDRLKPADLVESKEPFEYKNFKTEEDNRAIFSTEYLRPLKPLIAPKKLSTITFFMRRDYPLRVVVKDDDGKLDFEYIVAPRIEN